MNGVKGVGIAALTLYIAAILQMALAYRLSILGARPDFLLIALAVLGMFSSRIGGMLLGFAAGLAMASSGADLHHFITSRTLTGFLLGWIGGLPLPRSAPVGGVVAAAVTVVAQLVFMFLAPSHSIGAFLADTIRSAVYNGVLAIPVYALLNRFMAPPGR